MEVLFVVLSVFLSSYISTMAGFGSAVILIPILLLFYPLPLVIVFAGVVHLLVDFWQIIIFRTRINTRILIFFGIPSLIFGIIGARMFLVSDYQVIAKLLSLMLATYGVFELIKPNFSIQDTKLNNLLGGSLSGFVSGLTGIGGPARSIYLQALNLPKKEYIFMVGIVAFMVDISRVATYLTDGIEVPTQFIIISVAMLPVSLAASITARKTINHLSAKLFKKLVASFLLISGVILFIYY